MPLSKLTIGVGLVHIPIELENALGDGTKPTGKYVCASSARPLASGPIGSSPGGCNEKHANACVRATGYPRLDGTFFVPSEDALEEMKAEQDRIITLDTFVPVVDVDPIYFKRTTVIKPQKGAERALWLLARRLEKLGRIAVGRGVLDKDECLIFLRWSKPFGCLFLSVGVYDEQIKRALIEGAKATEPEKGYSRAEAQLADQMITGVYVEPFQADKYPPERWHKLRNLILENGASPDGKVPSLASDEHGPTIDLMAQLRATIDQQKKPKPAAKKPTRGSRKKVA